MIKELSGILILLPFITALCVYLIRSRRLRSVIVLVTGILLIASAVCLIPMVPFGFAAGDFLHIPIHKLVLAADFLLLFIVLYFGFKHKNMIIKILSVLQILLLACLELLLIKTPEADGTIYCDQLSLVMILIISIVGAFICFQAIPYMARHEHHLRLEKSTQHRFFLVMLLFLGAMNGLVLSNDMLFLYFFFEVTTVCSFLLIGHDGTDIAIKNAVRALWMNSLGGAAFIVALLGVYLHGGHLDLQLVIIEASPGSHIFMLSLALLCFASFTKSAQFPFQSWLLGAMVAPTPVSALLHSSTMVKVGVYLVLRLAPAFKGTILSQSVAVYGAFVFLAGAALAVGQSNGKKVLAYSTISNLGLIFACAGLNTSQAIIAAIFLIIFHAITKALLFLCVGAIEQHIASRDIEDMRGLYTSMPVTALITVMGVIMMIMPPFGVLLSKWMAIEAAAQNLFIIIIIAVGSALTVMYWARWAGILMSDPFAGKFRPERQPLLTWTSLGILCAGSGILSIGAPWVYKYLIAPAAGEFYLLPYTMSNGILENASGTFAVLPLGVVAFFGFLVSVWAVKRATKARVVTPYLSGIQTGEPGMFIGPMNQPTRAEAKNYYLSSLFGENNITIWINISSAILLMLILGGTL